MSGIVCRLIDVEVQHYPRPKDWDGRSSWRSSQLVDCTTGEPPQPGDMWFDPERLEWPNSLAPYYFANNAARAPLVVVLRAGVHFCVDSRTVSDGELGPDGWAVTGAAPTITVKPSIDAKGIWHGFLTDGVLTSC